MKKAKHEDKDGGGPSVIRFKARLFRSPDTAKTGPSTLLNVPKWVSKKFASHGMTKVEGTMNGQPFRAALTPNASGSHWLHVNKALREGARADAGDTVKLVILGPEPKPTVPADLRVSLTASREAKTLWKNLSLIGRRDWIRWIVSAKTPETRARRVSRTVELLSSGKRRPCCVKGVARFGPRALR